MGDGHRYTFGAPAGGWPSFGADGRRIKNGDQHCVVNGRTVIISADGSIDPPLELDGGATVESIRLPRLESRPAELDASGLPQDFLSEAVESIGRQEGAAAARCIDSPRAAYDSVGSTEPTEALGGDIEEEEAA